MATRHNTCINPCLTNNDTGWADGAEVPARTSVTGFVRPFAARYTTNVAGFARTPAGAAVAGQQYTVSMDIRPTSNATGTIYAEWRDAGNSVLSYTSNGYSANGGVVTRISHTGTAPTNTAFVRIIFDGINFGLNNTDVTAVLIEQAAALDTYFDGDSPNATWDGAAGNSASTLNDSPALSGTGTLATTVTLTASGATNSPPRITSTSAVADQLEVTAAATVEDDETLVGLELRIEWGDGNASTVTYPTLSASHTYAAGGVYPLLFQATDSAGESDYAANYVIVTAPDPTAFTLDLPDLMSELCSVVQRLGHFDTCDSHEPREAPNNALHAAFWLTSVRPARAASGLASASTIVTVTGRVYVPAGDGTSMPYDNIDQRMFAAVDRLLAAFCAKFTLGGRVRNVDIFGAHSPGLSAEAGYARFGGLTGKSFRITTITLPLIVNDMYPEVP